MKLLKSTIVLLLTFSLCSFANAEIVPGPKAKAVGDLGLVIVASDSPDYIKEWISTPSSHDITIKRLKEAKPEQLIITSFLVTGCTPDKDENISFTVSFALLDPSGKTLFSERDYAKASGKITNKPTFIIADPALDIVLEKSDPEGIYTILGFVKDLVSKKTARNSYKIKFTKNSL